MKQASSYPQEVLGKWGKDCGKVLSLQIWKIDFNTAPLQSFAKQGRQKVLLRKTLKKFSEKFGDKEKASDICSPFEKQGDWNKIKSYLKY